MIMVLDMHVAIAVVGAAIKGTAASLIVVSAIILCIVQWERGRMRREQLREEADKVIWIKESPQPTRTLMTSPMKSPPTRRTLRQKQRAERAGKKRVRAHKRIQTRTYSPITNGDCGHMVLLRAAAKVVTRKNVRALREEVGARIECEYDRRGAIQGIDVRAYLAAEEMSAQAYVLSTKERYVGFEIGDSRRSRNVRYQSEATRRKERLWRRKGKASDCDT